VRDLPVKNTYGRAPSLRALDPRLRVAKGQLFREPSHWDAATLLCLHQQCFSHLTYPFSGQPAVKIAAVLPEVFKAKWYVYCKPNL